tara:strand:- start:627 stop:1553 length:927 start_codon:yes stop_codon:yes gene_type:complete
MYTKNDLSLSILIPCYNWDIYALVCSLHKLCQESSNIQKFEILCLEDGSNQLFSNSQVLALNNVRYEKLAKNIGRAKIRNLIAEKALYNWLLFIDADSKLINHNFIETYIQIILSYTKRDLVKKVIYYGSTRYSCQKPKENQKLHWKYGQKIESKRKKETFSSHHFIIPKSYFNKHCVRFNKNIETYGYEDVFFILENNLTPIYIENPLLHLGIKTNEKFIEHTESALKNLINHRQLHKNYEQTIKILRVKQNLSKFKLITILVFLFSISKAMILKNLYSNYPSIKLFQFYKLGYFLELETNNNLLEK